MHHIPFRCEHKIITIERGMAVSNDTIIAEVVAHVARVFQPQRVILFGSHASGNASDDSDIDLLVMTDTDTDPREHALAIRKSVGCFPVACDIIVTDPASFARDRGVVNHIVYFADRYGRVVYER